VCGHCGSDLRERLRAIYRLAGDVTLTIARLDEVTRTGGGRVDDLGWDRTGNALEPMPLLPDLDRAERHDAAVGELSSWLRIVAEERGAPQRPWAGNVNRPPARLHPLAELIDGLIGNVEWLRHHPAADEAYSKILDACDEIERVIDTRTDTWYAGPCGVDGCEADLNPASGAETVKCEACSTVHPIAARKVWLLEQAQDVWGNAGWVAGALTRLGIRCTDSMVRGYAHRGRLAPHPEPDGRGYPRYRLGSVLELVTAEMQAATERRATAQQRREKRLQEAAA